MERDYLPVTISTGEVFEYDKWTDCISAPKNDILLAAARRRGDGMKAFAGSKAKFLMSLTIKMGRRYAA